MLMDERTEFLDATALNTGAAGTYNIGDVVDTQGPEIGHNAGQNLTRDLGISTETWLVIQVTSPISAGSAGTLQFRLVSDDVSTPNTATATVHAVTSPFTTGTTPIPAGTRLATIPLPSGNYERFLGIQQVTGTTAIAAGAIDAFLTTQPVGFRAYADNVA